MEWLGDRWINNWPDIDRATISENLQCEIPDFPQFKIAKEMSIRVVRLFCDVGFREGDLEFYSHQVQQLAEQVIGFAVPRLTNSWIF